jgi:hypothetical protein
LELRVYLSRVQQRAGRVVPLGPPVDTLAVVRGSHCHVALGIVTRIRHRAEEAGLHRIRFALDCADGDMGAEIRGELQVHLPAEDGVFAPDVVVQQVVLAPGAYVLRATLDGASALSEWLFHVVRTHPQRPSGA